MVSHRLLRISLRALMTAAMSVFLVSVLPVHAAPTSATPFASPLFEQVWNTTDKAVAEGHATRSWTWGPQPGYTTHEPYQQSPGGQRLVQYFDKARMEINDPTLTSGPLNGVTNGLLVVEMVSGRIKKGDGTDDDQNEQRQPAYVLPVAGDWAGQLGSTPRYASFRNFATIDNGYRDAKKQIGERVATTFQWAGEIGYHQELADFAGTDIVTYDETTGHNIPRVFDDFMNAGPVSALVAFGHPITDPYWIRSVVGHQERDILIQLFERRTITYTPTNPEQFQVEMGNVGQHYLYWRYGPGAQYW